MQANYDIIKLQYSKPEYRTRGNPPNELKRRKSMKSMSSRQKLITKTVSMILSFLIVFFCVPTILYVEAAEALLSDESEKSVSTDGIHSDDSASAFEYVGEAYEVTEMREENIKHFRLEDGSYVAVMYDQPVHYYDEDSSWVDIDNSLTEGASEIYTSDARIKFAKKITGNGNLFTLHSGDGKITLSLVGAEKKTVGVITSDHTSDDGIETKLGKLMNLENISSSVMYEEILPGVDLEYVAHSLNIKENIIVKEKNDEGYSYTFEIKLNNLTAALSEGGDIFIQNALGETVYFIPSPVVFDANGAYAPKEKAAFTFIDLGDGLYELTVTVDSEWMNAEERAYPVTVDPVLNVPCANMLDTYISSDSPDASFYDEEIIYASDTEYAYWKPTLLPTLPNGSYITDATVSFFAITGSTSPYVGAYRVTSDWSEGLTWNTWANNTGKGIIDSKLISVADASYGRFELDITALTRVWYENSARNHGIALKKLANLSFEANIIAAHGNTDLPIFTVNYVDVKGIEDYYGYSTHSVGMAGTGSINLASGRLTVATPLLSTTDYLMPLTLSAVYQSTYSGVYYDYGYGFGGSKSGYTSSYMPYGFKLNINETIVKESYTDSNGTTYYYVLADSDGTEHYFYKAADQQGEIYYDSDGLRIALNLTGNNPKLHYVDGTVKEFTALSSAPTGTLGAWCLSAIEDRNGNRVEIGLDSTSKRPVSLKLVPKALSAIEMLSLVYNNDKLAYVYNPTSRSATVLRYSSSATGSLVATGSKYLREVLFVKVAEGTDVATALSSFYSANTSNSTSTVSVLGKASYTYNISGRLTKLTDGTSARYVEYSYISSKVRTVTEYSADGTSGQKIGFTYGDGYTELQTSGSDDNYSTTADNIITRYIFDEYARVKSTYSTNYGRDEIYGAVSGKYEEQENVKNNIKESFAVGGTSATYLLNGDFSEWDYSYWDTSSGFTNANAYEYAKFYFQSSSQTQTVTYPTEEYISQNAYLFSGDYTLTFDYFINKYDQCSVKVSIIELDTSETLAEEIITTDFTTTTSTNLASVSFKIPTDENGARVKTKVKIKITFIKSGGTAFYGYLDNVTLTEGIGAVEFNSVVEGDFEGSALESNGNTMPAIDFWSSGSIASVADQFGNALKVTSTGITSNSMSYQNIYSATADDLYRYDNNYSANPFYPNNKQTYVVSGFGYAENVALGELSEFGIKAIVYYYQGSGNSDVVKEYLFSFVPGVSGWQFTSGVFTAEYSPEEGDTADYSCVRKIEIACVYLGQDSASYAYFDKITAAKTDHVPLSTYDYDEHGNLIKHDNGEEAVYYEYDDNYNVTVIGDDKGNLTYREYDADGKLLLREVGFRFGWEDNTSIPENEGKPVTTTESTEFYLDISLREEIPEARIKMVLDPQSYTEYSYNSFGLCTESTSAIAADETFYYVRLSNDDTNYTVNPFSVEGISTISSNAEITVSYTYILTSGSKIFGALLTESSEDAGTIRYFYDERGLQTAVVNVELGNGISYTYDELGRVVEVLPASYSQALNNYTEITNAENVSYTYDAEGYLSSIVTDSTTYTLTYDAFGNSSGVAAGDNTLAQYEYNANNGKLKKITYGNGYAERYVYDGLDRLSEVWYTVNSVETLAASYEYTRDGALYRVTDHRSGRVTEIKYDTRGRAVGYVEYSEDEGERYAEGYVTYDDESRVTKDVIYLLYNVGTEAAPEWNKVSSTLTYTYDDEGKLTASGRGGIYVSYTYDELGRIIGISNSISGSVCNETEYVYKDGTSGLIEKYVSTVGSGESAVVNEYTVEYNSRGYISRIIYPDGKNIFYTYDDLGQLVREANEVLGKTYEYEYDNAGNLIGKNNRNYSSGIITSQENYGYYDTEWGDRLTDYNEADLVNLYDEIGNPTRWRGGEFTNMTWEGRRLVSALKGNVQYTFTYNDEGIRTSKTVNGVEHKYTLNGTQILSEQWGDNLLVFIYDTTGAPIGMRYLNTADSTAVWETYWFEKNLFGDIVAVYDTDGTKLVSYLYDAWGNQTVTTHVSGTAAQYNPFRYRGYYYDADFGLYYLQSRYYDSMSYRFINADIFVSTGQGLTGSNMFAYCGNNPVNFVDPTGEFWDYVFDAVFIVWGIVDVINDPGDWTNWAALGIDLVFAIIPFVPSGAGKAIKIANKFDNGIDAVGSVGKVVAYSDDAIGLTKKYGYIEDFANNGGIIRRATDADFIDDSWRFIDGISTTADGFTVSNRFAGSQIHKKFMYKEFVINPRNRADGLDDSLRIIYELKPYNQRSIRQGIHQLYRYQSAMYEKTNIMYKMVLVLY